MLSLGDGGADGEISGRKPRGLWTSTWDGQRSDWMRWCCAEGFRVREESPNSRTFDRVWLLTPRANTRVLRINSHSDLVKVVETWPGEDPFAALPGIRPRELRPHWGAVALECDAVWLTERGLAETRLPPSGPDLYAWDCESTCWFGLPFEAVEDGGKLTVVGDPDAEWRADAS